MRKFSGTKWLMIAVAAAAGGGDFATGLLLMIAPAWTLSLMRAPAAREPVYIGFIGCFVCMVGASYLWGLGTWLRSGSSIRLRIVLELTILFRTTVGAFVLFHVLLGNLSPPWLSVTATDWFWAATQFALLRSKALQKETGSTEGPQ